MLSDSQVSLSQGFSCCKPGTVRPREQGSGLAKAGPAGVWPTHSCKTQPCRPSGRQPCQLRGPMVPRPDGGQGRATASWSVRGGLLSLPAHSFPGFPSITQALAASLRSSSSASRSAEQGPRDQLRGQRPWLGGGLPLAWEPGASGGLWSAPLASGSQRALWRGQLLI